MGLEQILIGTLAALAVYAVHTIPALSLHDRLPAPALSAADGALRLARRRLLRGEIDSAEYERIRAVLCN